MRLSGVACALPTERVSNEQVLDLVAHYSRGVYREQIADLMASLDSKLTRAGIVNRYWRAPGERPAALLRQASEDALRLSGIRSSDVDLVIYVGVDRGFAEPANACFLARDLGMRHVRTFDIVDACLGWVTATEVVQDLFAAGRAGCALIASAEFPMRSDGVVIPDCFRIRSDAELDWKFPAFTLGEGASASILLNESGSWRYVHESDNDLADLCTVPLAPSTDYAEPTPRLAPPESRAFRAYGNDLGRQIVWPAVRVLREVVRHTGADRIVFPHSVIGAYIEQVIARVNPRLRVFSTFAEMGNLATSSLPSCIQRAREQGLLNANDVPIGWAAASGLKVSAFEMIQ